MKIYQSINDLVGHTPLLELTKIEQQYGLQAKLVAKLEYLNPAGSIKDRIAINMLKRAEEQGLLKSGSTIIEPTSGNTGIGLCAYSRQKGYRTIIVMPSTMSIERQKLMRAYGGEVVLSDGSLGMKGAIMKAKELASEIENSFIPSQFDNPYNSEAHYLTTGPEIWEDSDGLVDIVVAGVGTGGTISGIGKYLKEKKDIKMVAVEPFNSAVISGEKGGKHAIQGIGAGFIPSILNREVIDEIIKVKDEEALEKARLFGQKEGFLVGISSGAALVAAIKLAQREENRGKMIVLILPDSGDRYLSTALFA